MPLLSVFALAPALTLTLSSRVSLSSCVSTEDLENQMRMLHFVKPSDPVTSSNDLADLVTPKLAVLTGAADRGSYRPCNSRMGS